MDFSSRLLESAVNEMAQFPGIGKRTALRLVLHLLKQPKSHTQKLSESLQQMRDEIIFCNGGDRKAENIPEMNVQGITFLFGVGGEHKMNSSSSILKDWQFENEDRVWGKFYNLFQDHRVKLKELILEAGKGMSFQRHQYRNEIWFISKGSCLVKHSLSGPEDISETNLGTEEVFHVKQGEWHQLINPSDSNCHIIEIQYGESTSEEDIERLFYYDQN